MVMTLAKKPNLPQRAGVIWFCVQVCIGVSSAQTKLDSLVAHYWNEESPFRRSIIVEQIGATKDTSALHFLVTCASDSELEIRNASYTAMADLGDRRAIPFLLKSWEKPRDKDRTQLDYQPAVFEKGTIAASLVRLGRREHMRYILRHLRSPDKGTRFNMVYLLCDIGGQHATNALLDVLLTDESEMVSRAALDALRKLRRLENAGTGRNPKGLSTSYLMRLFGPVE